MIKQWALILGAFQGRPEVKRLVEIRDKAYAENDRETHDKTTLKLKRLLSKLDDEN